MVEEVPVAIGATGTGHAPPAPPRAAPPRGLRAGWRRWRLPGVLAGLGWLIVVALALIAFLRLVAWDDAEPLAVLNAANGVLYLAAWPVLVAGALGRRFVLAAAALLIVVVQVLFALPELTAAQAVPAWTAGAPTLHLFDANVFNQNTSMTGYADQIKALRPELVTLEEANPADAAQLRSEGALAGLPFRFGIDRFDPFAFFIASRYPLVRTRVVSLFGRPLVVQTTLELPSGPQPLWVVHTVAPVPGSYGQWKTQLARIGQLVREDRRRPQLLVVGDFNATWGSRGFRAILGTGLVDGAAARGDPFEMTWSQTFGFLPPLVRIDHVLTGDRLAVTSIVTGDGPGSDHRDLRVTLALRL